MRCVRVLARTPGTQLARARRGAVARIFAFNIHQCCTYFMALHGVHTADIFLGRVRRLPFRTPVSHTLHSASATRHK